jgi:2-methylisocitrate lyase-like PEP mutase family enzyme
VSAATAEQIRKAEAFRALHFASAPLVLVNAWDAASARIIEELGFPAVATTSAGIAFSRGFPDGQKIHRDEMMNAVAQIVDSVSVPVTADAEAGYGDSPESAAETARRVMQAGAVGMNFEDATSQPEQPLADMSLQVERVLAIREAANQTGVPLVLNARTDVYLLQVGDPATRYDETVKRLIAYRNAGADCVFAPGIRDARTIGRLVNDLPCPLNVLAVPGSPSVFELNALGVKRISLGSGPMRAAMGLLRKLANEVKTYGTYALMQDAPSHAEMNQLMSAKGKPAPGK